MEKIGLHEIRREYLEFFKNKSHLVVPSHSLVPKDDKSLLLIGAGMAPLKKYFTGELVPENKRMASCQKCIRTGDIDNVGITDRHGTFFEMLGNFSFGDYFKEEAIEWSWEFLTENLGIPGEDLWVTVYLNDDEAEDIWHEKIGIEKEKIVRLGKEDNFWELEVGPSGPCSEIYVDRGETVGCGEATCKPGCECDRFLEIWNLVFTQFDKDSKGNYNPLPNPNIDTGMGLERVTAYLEGVESIFEIRAIREILESVERASKKKYGSNPKDDISMRIITDHARAVTFLVSDKVVPSNEGRGYVLRRLIRRAARHGKLLGIEGEFLSAIVEEVINSWKVEYKELEKNQAYILDVVETEEKRFQETIDQGLNILEDYIGEMQAKNEDTLRGEYAFKLYDTFGFPLDLTREIMKERNLSVDIDGFNEHMEKQRQMARAARDTSDSGWSAEEDLSLFEGIETDFLGYEMDRATGKVLRIVRDGEIVDRAHEGDRLILLMDRTPFYPEGGGQVGDKGLISSSKGEFQVLDTRATKKGQLLHIGQLLQGELALGDELDMTIESGRRDFIRKNHTATHLLHRALKDVLGQDTNQAGSVVDGDRLRFDFTYPKSISDQELRDIENIVNRKIFEGLDVKTTVTSIQKAKEMGAVGLFESKYGEEVRVLEIGSYSIELCGGTHVSNTAEIGLFKIVSESSVSSGIRRIEAITSRAVYEYIEGLESDIDEIAAKLKSNRANLKDRVEVVVKDLDQAEKELEKLKDKLASSASDSLLDEVEEIGGLNFIAKKMDNMGMKELRNLSDELKNKLGSVFLVLAGLENDKVFFVVTGTKDIIARGIHSGNIIREVAGVTGGSGGGRPDMAQAGGKDKDKVDEALDLSRELFKEQLK